MHRRNFVTQSECGTLDQDSGIFLVEAMRYAVNKINSNSSNLFGAKLGYRIMDTCSETMHLRQDLVRMILANRTVGVVGPPTSDEAMLASAALGIFRMSIISHSATSIDLQDRDKYYNFYRTVPADDTQAEALRDILLHFNWTYVSTVNSYGSFGQAGINHFIRLLPNARICISTRNGLPKLPNRSDYERVIRNLQRDSNARTVVLFTTTEDTRGLMMAAKPHMNFTWISSSAWTSDFEAIEGIQDIAKGALILNYAGVNDAEFMKHFKGLKLSNNNYGWFREFWEDVFNCTANTNSTSNRRICKGNESLANSSFYGAYTQAKLVIDAVNVYAYAIRCLIDYSCGKYKGANFTRCVDKLSTYRTRYYVGLFVRKLYIRCKNIFHRVRFDENGTKYRDLEILNFDGNSYKTVGLWKKLGSPSLNISENLITWTYGLKKAPESICSVPCKQGEKMIKSRTKECCFTCHPCGGSQILWNNTCVSCGKYETPYENRSVCKGLEKFKIGIKHYLSLIILAESVVGILLNTVVLLLFVKHKDTKVVRASSRELSFFILIGLYLCFLSPCFFLLDPSTIRCGLRRFIFGISLTACYTPLMLKTNRIYRIFNAAQTMVAMPHLVTPRSQILICFGLLALQLLLCVMWVVGDPPVVTQEIVTRYNMVAELCGANIFTIVINLVPCFCMMAISTVYAFKSRKFPKNYNEAFNIGVTMYVSCVLWAIFIPLLLWVKVESWNPYAQTFVIANFSNVIGLVSLIGLFGPKVYRLTLPQKQGGGSVEMFSVTQKKHSVNNSLENSIDWSEIGTVDEDKRSIELVAMKQEKQETEMKKVVARRRKSI